MFRKSQKDSVPNLFSGFGQLLDEAKAGTLYDEEAWYNQFHAEVTSQIDEAPFEVLYTIGFGRPNAPIRVLIGMMILKEGKGWTDRELHESCQFDLRVMRALGFNNFTDSAPALSTYYEFKVRLALHQVEVGQDLIGEAFARLTGQQANVFGVEGKWIRWDSKLFGSNIARCNRLQLVIGVLQKFYKSLSAQQRCKLPGRERAELEELCNNTAGQQTYRLDNEAKQERLEQLGQVLLKVYQTYKYEDSPEYGLIKRLLAEQYGQEQDSDEPPKPKEDGQLEGKSLQSAHDEDATFRSKGRGKNKQQVRGYSSNITETCNDEGLNLITSVQVQAATHPDDAFVPEALDNTKAMVGHIHNGTSDGAYHSLPNHELITQEKMNWFLTAIQGSPGQYAFKRLAGGALEVTGLKTGEVQIAKRTAKRWRIKLEGRKSKYRYFELHTVDNYFRRQAIEQWPEYIRNKRPNVEATIRHVFCTLDGKKSKYRGKIANSLFVHLRCFWVNFIRIFNYEGPKVRPALEVVAQKVQESAHNFVLDIFSAFFVLSLLLEAQDREPARNRSFPSAGLHLARPLNSGAS